MKKHPRTKNQRKLDRVGNLERMAESKPKDKATEAFKRKPYSTKKKETLQQKEE